jgi:transcriptional regulator with XRE-family HTH domain/Zn-dependent peptidase ImmA (M78 family)
MNATQRWDDSSYQRITTVAFKDGTLKVTFDNGETVEVDAQSLLPPSAVQPRWEELKHDAFELCVPTKDRMVEIPSSRIRVLTDEDYSAHLADAAEEQAKKIGRRIRQLRKSRGLIMSELASRAGIARQSLSRIENGKHDVVFTTLRKLLAAMDCSLSDLANADSPDYRKLVRDAKKIGLDRQFLLDQFFGGEDVDSGADVPKVWDRLATVFGSANYILNQPAQHSSLTEARFKTPKGPARVKHAAYFVYAHWLGSVVVKALKKKDKTRLPASGRKLREALLKNHDQITFEALLSYSWRHGVVVVPLDIAGGFHGACWRNGDLSVVCLKQPSRYPARWLFDLGHELGHIAKHLSSDKPIVVDAEEVTPFADDDEEYEASKYANDILFAGQQEELAQECVSAAAGKLPRLKSATQKIAAARNVPIDALANYLAFRLTEPGQKWWPTANTLQNKRPDPLKLARKLLLMHIDVARLCDDERDLLSLALGGVEWK